MATATLLYRELASRLPSANVVMNTDVFREFDEAINQADVAIVIIGPRWTEMVQVRLQAEDWLRHEVAAALRIRSSGGRRLRVLPILIGHATPPSAAELPADLALLAHLSMLRFDEGQLEASMDSLLESLQREGLRGSARLQMSPPRLVRN